MQERCAVPVAGRRARLWVVSLFGAVLGCSGSARCVADGVTVHSALEDTQLYFTAPLRWDEEDWLYFGGALVAIGASHEFDRRVRDHFATGSNAILNGADKNSLRDALPAVGLIAGTGIYAAFIRDPDGYQETWSLFEAGMFSTVTAEALSYAAGRERPDATTSPNQWRDGGDSFPSVHTSAGMMITGGFDASWAMALPGRRATSACATTCTGCPIRLPARRSASPPRASCSTVAKVTATPPCSFFLPKMAGGFRIRCKPIDRLESHTRGVCRARTFSGVNFPAWTPLFRFC
jgi:hypothetical protein